MGKEKRKHKRTEVGLYHLKGTLAVISGNGASGCLVTIKDFSKLGAGVYLKLEVKPKTKVMISIEGLPYSPIEGKVIWCGSTLGIETAPAGYSHHLGIEFTPSGEAALENQMNVFKHVSKLAGIPSE